MALSMASQIHQAELKAYEKGLEKGAATSLKKVAEAVDNVLEHGGTAEQRTTLRAVKTVCLMVAEGVENSEAAKVAYERSLDLATGGK